MTCVAVPTRQVRFAERMRREVGIATRGGGVGIVANGRQAEEVGVGKRHAWGERGGNEGFGPLPAGGSRACCEQVLHLPLARAQACSLQPTAPNTPRQQNAHPPPLPVVVPLCAV